MKTELKFSKVFVEKKNREKKKKKFVKMARVKSFFGSDLKTGGYVIGYVSLFANIINFILAIETILITFIEPSQEKKALFGNYINEISASSIAFTFVLFALVASLYGIIASLLLICGVCTVRVQLHS